MGVWEPDLFGARFGGGLPIAGAVDELAHAFEPPVGAVEPAAPGGRGLAGTGAGEAEFQLVVEGGGHCRGGALGVRVSVVAVGLIYVFHSFFVLLWQRGLDKYGPTEKNSFIWINKM